MFTSVLTSYSAPRSGGAHHLWRALGSFVIACLALSSVLHAQSSAPTAPLTLEAAFARALDANRTIAAARLRRAIDLAGIGVARERPNPETRIEFERETPKEAYGLAFTLETAGKRQRRIAIGEATLRTGEAELARSILEVRSAVRRAYFSRLIADARLTLLNELLDLSTRARAAAQQRFEAGSAPRLEVVQADLALAQAENDAMAARGTATAARVQLNALLAFPLDAVPSLVSSPDSDVMPSPEAAIGRAQTGNVELAVLDRRLGEQRARLALARAMQVPDVVPEGTVTRNAEPEFNTGWRTGLTLAVPLFTRHRAGVRVEESTLTQLTAERAAALARVTADAAAAAAVADAQRQQYLRYRDQILARAADVERMAEDSYRLGQTGIAAFLQALQSSRDARLRALQSALDFQNSLADLERAIGTPLP